MRHNCVLDGCELPNNFYVPSTTKVNYNTDLSTIPKVSAEASDFSEDVVRANIELVQGYKKLSNEF